MRWRGEEVDRWRNELNISYNYSSRTQIKQGIDSRDSGLGGGSASTIRTA